MGLIVRLLLNGLAVFLAAQLVPGIEVKGFGTALLAALILGIVNTVIRPVLVFFTLPISFLTLGLFIFVINALLFWLVGAFVSGFEVDGFLSAFFGAIIVSVISWALNGIWKSMRN
ncbi:putative membrane protein [Planifilum fimeticola]|jgi:putative membrane protein|uniref:Putative membrane protein n=1 Tax=Planifilum fimeticola TaxID=201975 RepID=A0A2T0LGL6_9BACL|nr:phage holin family protein [Planifilum fimeticola]PRX41442.1 putative membrane protein [Planifilum fimeticola]